jgi:hypothetical protein
MNMQDWSNLAQAFGLVATPLGLFYAALQLRAAKHSTETAAYLQFENTVLQVGRFFVEHPKLRAYFYGEKDPDDPHDTSDETVLLQLPSATEFMADFFDHCVTVQKRIPRAADWSLELWEEWIKSVLRSSPCLRKYVKEQNQWYVDMLVDLYKLKLLKKTKLPPVLSWIDVGRREVAKLEQDEQIAALRERLEQELFTTDGGR